MTDNKLINAVIQLISKEEKAGKFGPMAKLKDDKGLTYTVYKTKKDGSVSVAWDQLQELIVGDVVQISFAEEIVNHPEHGAYTARTIRSFNKDIGNGVRNAESHQTTPSTEKPRGVANSASGRASNEAFGRRLGVQGHINALLSNPNVYPKGFPQDIIALAIQIEDEAERQLAFKPVANAPADYQDDPTHGVLNPMVNDEPELNVEDIPW